MVAYGGLVVAYHEAMALTRYGAALARSDHDTPSTSWSNLAMKAMAHMSWWDLAGRSRSNQGRCHVARLGHICPKVGCPWPDLVADYDIKCLFVKKLFKKQFGLILNLKKTKSYSNSTQRWKHFRYLIKKIALHCKTYLKYH